MVTIGSIQRQAPRGVVYIPRPQPPAPRQPQRPKATSGRTTAKGQVDRGGAPRTPVGQSSDDDLLDQVRNDPGVKAANQKGAQKQAEKQAYDQGGFLDKLGMTVGKALQPLDYLSYGKRAVQTLILEAEEGLLNESDKTPHWMRFMTAKPSQLNWFTPPDEVRAGRSNWDLIQGKAGVKPDGTPVQGFGGGQMIQDIPSGPAIGPSWFNIKPGQLADRLLGMGLDIGEDPLTHATTGGFRVIDRAAAAKGTADFTQEAARTQVDDLAKMLTEAANNGVETLDPKLLEDVTSRAAQQLELGDRAAQAAEAAPKGPSVVKLPKGRLGRSQLAAELKLTLPKETYERLLPDINRAVTRGFEQASPELKEAAGILPGGLRLYGFRVPGTGLVGEGVGAAKAVVGKTVPGLSQWRDPKGLGQALDTLARGRGGNVDDAITRVMMEDWIRVGEGNLRHGGSRLTRDFFKNTIAPMRRSVGREGIEDMVHTAETLGATPLNKVFNDVLTMFEKETGRGIDPEFLLERQTYVPHKLTGDFKRFLRKNAKDEQVVAFKDESAFMSDDVLDQATAITRKRAFKPNADGSPTTVPIGNRRLVINDGSIRDLNQGLAKVFPEFKGKFYEDDPAILLESYLQSRAKEAGVISAMNRAAAHPNVESVQRVSGGLADQLIERNKALGRDPYRDLISQPYDQASAATFAQDNLGAARGPGQEAPIGPRLPTAENWVDTDPRLGSHIDPEATRLRNQAYIDVKKAGEEEGAKSFRTQAREGQREYMGTLRDQFSDLKTRVTAGLNKPWRDSVEEVRAMTRKLTNLRERIRKLNIKEGTAQADVESAINEANIRRIALEQQLQVARDEVGNSATRAEQQVIKSMEQRLDELKAMHADAQAKLAEGPARMRDEIRARTDALDAPLRKAEAEMAKVNDAIEARSTAAGASRTRLRNAKAVMDDVPEGFAADQARLAELDQILEQKVFGGRTVGNAELADVRAERRALAKKFTRDGEYGRVKRAQDVLKKRADAESFHAADLAKAQRNMDSAMLAAEQQQEAVIRGELLPEQHQMRPNTDEPAFKTVRVEGPWPAGGERPTLHDPATGQQVLVPDVIPPKQLYQTGTERGFGVGEQRQYVPPAQMTPEEAAAQQAAQAQRLGAQQRGLPAPAGSRSEQEALAALEAEAKRTEQGGGILGARAQSAQRNVDREQLLQSRGVPADHPAIAAARDDAEREVARLDQELATQVQQGQLSVDNAKDRLATVSRDKAQVMGTLDQTLGDRDVLRARREYHQIERRKVQRELRGIAKETKVGKRANLEELANVYDDLEMIAWANPSLDNKAMQSVEAQLNRVADGLHSGAASQMTNYHVQNMMQAAKDRELGPLMYTTAGAGWKQMHAGPLHVGDLIFTRGLEEQMRNLHRIVDEPTLLGRTFGALTNLFKTYATLSPGFHVRNALSAIFMNTADDVGFLHQIHGAKLWTGMTNAMRKGEGEAWLADATARNPQLRQALEATVASGAGGRFGEAGFAEVSGGTHRQFWKWLNSNKVTRFSQHVGQWVEGGVRLGMALDSIAKGDTVEGALQRISRIHFDYAQVSKMDEAAKTIIPFWTYYSRNLPLQIQMMYTQPKAYSWFMSATAAAPPDAQFTPQYWDQPGNFKTDTTVGGSPLYMNFDLPFSRSGEQIGDLVQLTQGDWQGVISQANPWLVAPAEWYTGQDFFTGARYDRNNPASYAKVSGVLGAVITGLASNKNKDAAGRVYTPFTNMIRSVLPMVDRAARMDPTGKVLDVEGQNAKEPMWMSYARWAGAPTRLLTPAVQEATKRGEYYDKRDAARMRAASAAYLAQQKTG